MTEPISWNEMDYIGKTQWIEMNQGHKHTMPSYLAKLEADLEEAKKQASRLEKQLARAEDRTKGAEGFLTGAMAILAKHGLMPSSQELIRAAKE